MPGEGTKSLGLLFSLTGVLVWPDWTFLGNTGCTRGVLDLKNLLGVISILSDFICSVFSQPAALGMNCIN